MHRHQRQEKSSQFCTPLTTFPPANLRIRSCQRIDTSKGADMSNPTNPSQPQYASPAPPNFPPARDPRIADAASKKISAGICGILLGGLGIHKFILDYTSAGVIMLLVTILSCGIAGIVMNVIGIVEGIMYLSKTDEQFYEIYILNRKEWF
jgi:TM2 domain-containing membrane protein YozV